MIRYGPESATPELNVKVTVSFQITYLLRHHWILISSLHHTLCPDNVVQCRLLRRHQYTLQHLCDPLSQAFLLKVKWNGTMGIWVQDKGKELAVSCIIIPGPSFNTIDDHTFAVPGHFCGTNCYLKFKIVRAKPFLNPSLRHICSSWLTICFNIIFNKIFLTIFLIFFIFYCLIILIFLSNIILLSALEYFDNFSALEM